MELVPLVKSSMPDATHYPHPQDVANLILYLQTELALFEQWAAQEGIPPAALRPIERSQEALRRAVDQFDLSCGSGTANSPMASGISLGA
jgi:hypothetical protein